MGLTLADQYYLKAEGAVGNRFCTDWEEACEALNYALSYEEEHCPSLCLLGKIYAVHLQDYTEAFACFDKVIAINNQYTAVYPLYARYLIWANELERAKKLINFALSLKKADKGSLWQLKAYSREVEKEYKGALKALKTAKRHSYNDDFLYYLEQEERRIKKKQKMGKEGKKGKKGRKRTKRRK